MFAGDVLATDVLAAAAAAVGGGGGGGSCGGHVFLLALPRMSSINVIQQLTKGDFRLLLTGNRLNFTIFLVDNYRELRTIRGHLMSRNRLSGPADYSIVAREWNGHAIVLAYGRRALGCWPVASRCWHGTDIRTDKVHKT